MKERCERELIYKLLDEYIAKQLAKEKAEKNEKERIWKKFFDTPMPEEKIYEITVSQFRFV